MPTVFPGGLDSFTNPNPAEGHQLNTPEVLHTDQHADANDAIEALEAKLGVDGSANTNTVDWKLNDVISDYAGHIAATQDQHPAADIINTPAGNIASTTVQAALNELDSEKGGLTLANTWSQKNIFSGEVEIDGDINHDGANIGFFGATPVGQGANNLDLKNLLVNLGLIADGGATPLNLDGGALNAGAGTFSADIGAVNAVFSGNLEVDGDLNHDGSNVGFFGVAPTTRATATTDIKDALTSYGLLQGTSASSLDLDGGDLSANDGTFSGDISATTGTVTSLNSIVTGDFNHDALDLGYTGATPSPAVGFFGVTPIVQRPTVADPAGGTTIDAEARTAINEILATLEAYGLHASA